MTKNGGKGGKSHKKQKNADASNDNKELLFKEDGQDYAIVVKMLGSGRCELNCYNDLNKCNRMGIIRGNMRKKSMHMFIRKGDIVHVSQRDYQDNKVDIIHLYSHEDVRSLKTYEEVVDILDEKWVTKSDENDMIEFNV